MTRLRTVICAVLVALALPGAALAGTRNGLPRGNAGAYQYVESIPTAHGARPDPSVSPKPGGGGSSIAQGTRQSLLDAGSTGQAAYSAAAATAPQGPRHARHARRLKHGKKTGAAAAGGGSTPPPAGAQSIPSGTGRGAAVASAVLGIGSGGSVIAFILLIAVAAGAAALRLRRRPSGDPR